MTAKYETTIWCDGCGNWDRSCEEIAGHRRTLKKKGWSRSRSDDFCPTCTKKIEEGRHEQVDQGVQS
jgi:hypothetical protein